MVEEADAIVLRSCAVSEDLVRQAYAPSTLASRATLYVNRSECTTTRLSGQRSRIFVRSSSPSI